MPNNTQEVQPAQPENLDCTVSKQQTSCVKNCAIGGQALIEGVMMRGKTARAICVRSEEGEKLLETVRLKKPKTKVHKVPFVRGVVNFISMMVDGTKSLMKSAEVFGTDDEELPKGFFGFSVFFGIAISVLLFIFLPSLIMDGFIALGCPDTALLTAVIEGAIRLVVFIGFLFLTYCLKDMRRTYRYHGAEHKTINCYEHGLPLTVENVRNSSKVHKRCGTTFLFIVLVVTIILFALANWLVADVIGWTNSWWVKILVRLVLLPFVMGISYEVLKFLAWLPDNKFVTVLRAPGLALQAITTKQPDDQMIECAITAFEAVLAMDADSDLPEVRFDTVDIKICKERVQAMLQPTDVEECEVDWILCKALDCGRGEIASHNEIKRVQYNRALGYAKKRAEGVPLAYVLGETEFYGEKVIVTPAVLIPRPETELVAEQAILALKDKADARALDLCTGSGCIALSLAKNTRAEVVASDNSPAALNVARRNLLAAQVTIVESDLLQKIEGEFDVIVSNPPYIPTQELGQLQAEVKKEPVSALNGGEDGLAFYREICMTAGAHLKKDGALILELGIGQAQAVAEMLTGWAVEIKKDYQGIDRILIAKRGEDYAG